MAKPQSPDFYIAAIGRSGSTMLSNWLSSPPDRVVFNEPFFLRPGNSRLLRIQLESLGLPVSDADWAQGDETALQRFRRLMGPRLEGSRWAAKEVLCQEHFAMTATFSPSRVLVTVRDIVDVALSFLEKHRLQNNLDRFGDDWVEEYCIRESAGILDYLAYLDSLGIPFRTVRYEDLIVSAQEQAAVEAFTGWPGGGAADLNFDAFDRAFEAERHGRSISGSSRTRRQRVLEKACLDHAIAIGERCEPYQRRFDYLQQM